MSRILCRLAMLSVLCASASLANEHAEAGADQTTMWKWVNFGILAVALTVIAVRVGGPALKAQKEQIQNDLAKAREAKAAADRQVAEIEKRLGNLDGEIAAFRTESKQRAELEGARLREETAAMVRAIEDRSLLEVESLANAASSELRREVAALAVQMAEQRLAGGIPADRQAELVTRFLDEVERMAA